MQVSVRMRRKGVGISHGAFTSFIYELFCNGFGELDYVCNY